MKAKDLRIVANWGGVEQSISSKLKIPDDTEIEFIGIQTTGDYQAKITSVYKIINTKKYIVVDHRGKYDRVSIKTENQMKSMFYEKKCSEASKRLNLPFKICIAVGPDGIVEFKKLYEKLISLDEQTIKMLKKNYEQRLSAILSLFPGMSPELYENFKTMGRVRLKTISDWILSTKVK